MKLVTDKSRLAETICNETPYYFWDLDVFSARISHVVKIFSNIPNFRLFYAIKANSSRYILTAALKSGINVDVCSVNELSLALDTGYSPDKISGCIFAPSKQELEEFIHSDCDIDIDSLEDLKLFCSIDHSKSSIGLRVNPDVEAGFHEHCTSGVWNSKFGIPLAEIHDAINIAEANNKKIDGLHIHVGSSSYETAPYLKAIELIFQSIKRSSLELRYINIGGGWGIPFDTQDDQNSEFKFPLQEYADGIARLLKQYEISEKTEIRAEPGEYLIGPCGFLVCTVRRVIERRKSMQYQRLVVVDAGTYLYPGPALYGSDNFVWLLNRKEDEKADQILAGRSMMAGDIFGPERDMPLLQQGDVIAIGCAGAYSQVKSCRFNLLPMAKECAFHG